MIKFNEETYIALTDLAKLRCAAAVLSQVFNKESLISAGQEIYREIDRLEALIDKPKETKP